MQSLNRQNQSCNSFISFKMKLFTSFALAAAGVSATTVEDKCLICSHVGFAASEDAAIAGKRFKIID